MATARDLRSIALSLEGTTESPHFDRAAFRVSRIYATLAADGKSANLKFTPEEQSLWMEMAPLALVPVAGGWGAQGWTTVVLAKVTKPVLEQALRTAWTGARSKTRKEKG